MTLARTCAGVRSWKRGASQATVPSGSKHLADRPRCPTTGVGGVSAATSKWRMPTSALPGRRAGLSQCMHPVGLPASPGFYHSPGTGGEGLATPIAPVATQRFAWATDAEAAIAAYEGRERGRRGRQPQPWRSHVFQSTVDAVQQPKKRTRRGRPPTGEGPVKEVCYRLGVQTEARVQAEDEPGWCVLAHDRRPCDLFGCPNCPSLS